MQFSRRQVQVKVDKQTPKKPRKINPIPKTPLTKPPSKQQRFGFGNKQANWNETKSMPHIYVYTIYISLKF